MHDARTLSNLTRLGLGLTLTAAAVFAFADNPLHIVVRPLFEGITVVNGIAPMEVLLQNSGPNAVGAVVVDSGDGTISYPVELPQGASKRLVAYPDLGDYAINPTQFSLETDQGRAKTEVQPRYGGSSVAEGDLVFGMVAETSGDLAFLKSVQGFPYRVRDAYVQPEGAPGRPIAYARLSAVFLGTGSERISNDAVKALKMWAMGGGVLIFTGGASSPVLNDPRWSDVMPVHNASPKNFAGSNVLSHRYEYPTPEYTAMLGQPVVGASSRVGGMIVEKSLGLGRTVYLAVNPFEKPLQAWGARGRLFLEVLSPAAMATAKLVTSSVVQEAPKVSAGFSSGPGGAPPVATKRRAQNPFDAKLPATGKVFLILALYFVAVVPLNFIVLRKLKRAEWAWASAPILSLTFAAVFFASAKDLYGAGLATTSEGLLVAQQGIPDALVIARTQMFFPQGGNYDLLLTGVDNLSKDNPDDSPFTYSGRTQTRSEIDSIDRGEIRAIAKVPNLAFREIFYRATLPAGNWYTVERVAPSTFRVANNSPYTLAGPRLCVDGGSVSFPDLPPKGVRQVVYQKPDVDTEGMTGQFARLLGRTGCLGLTGALRGYRVGPQIGREAPSNMGVRLAFVSNVPLREATP